MKNRSKRVVRRDSKPNLTMNITQYDVIQIFVEDQDVRTVVKGRSIFREVGTNSPLAPGRPTDGWVTPIPCCMLRSTCVPVGGEGCTRPGVLVSMKNLTVFAMESRFDLGMNTFTPRSGLK